MNQPLKPGALYVQEYVANKPSKLYTLDLATGKATPVGDITTEVYDLVFIGESFYGLDKKDFGFRKTMKLIKIDPTTGQSRPVGDTWFDVVGMDYNPADQKLYGTAHRNHQIIEIDIANGHGKSVVTLSDRDRLCGEIAFDASGNAFISLIGTDLKKYLATCDLTTGKVTIIGDIGFPGLASMKFVGDTLYGVAGHYEGVGGSNGQVLRIDTTTGQGTLVTTTEPLGCWAGMAVYAPVSAAAGAAISSHPDVSPPPPAKEPAAKIPANNPPVSAPQPPVSTPPKEVTPKVPVAIDDVSNNQEIPMSKLILTGTIRDFQDSHADFEAAVGSEKNIVEPLLGTDQKPVYKGGSGKTTTGKENFDQWFRDIPTVNRSKQHDIELEDKDGNGVFTYENHQFFPIDNDLFGNQGRPHNYHFTYEIHSEFTYQGHEQFMFWGDDDLWVFIDGKLVIDLGGVHVAETDTIDLKVAAAATQLHKPLPTGQTLVLEKGKTYSLDLFFAERRTTESHFKIETSLRLKTVKPEPPVYPPVMPPMPPLPPNIWDVGERVVCVAPIRTMIRREEEIVLIRRVRKVEEVEASPTCPTGTAPASEIKS